MKQTKPETKALLTTIEVLAPLDKKGRRRVLAAVSSYYALRPPPQDGGVLDDPTPRGRILRILSDGAVWKAKDLQKLLDRPQSTVSAMLTKLTEEKILERVGCGRYIIRGKAANRARPKR